MLKQLLFLTVCVLHAHCWTLFGDPRVEAHEDVDQQCLRYAAWGSCDFYDCLERRFPCGHDGYAIKVGKHFCEKGQEMKSQLISRQSRDYFNSSSVCLTQALVPVYESYASRCGDITDESVSAIIDCSRQEYHGMDLCEFIGENTGAYNSMYGVDEISRLLSLRKPSLLSRLFMDGASCGAEALNARFNSIAGSINDALGSFVESWNTFSTRMNSWWN